MLLFPVPANQVRWNLHILLILVKILSIAGMFVFLPWNVAFACLCSFQLGFWTAIISASPPVINDDPDLIARDYSQPCYFWTLHLYLHFPF